MITRMDAQAKTLAKRVLRLAVRIWPSESCEWGQALEAELDLIESGKDALLWAFGGLAVFARAVWKSFCRSLRRPFGVAPGSDDEKLLARAMRMPRTPRWVTGSLLIASLVLLFLPEAREGLSEVFTSWQDPFASNAAHLNMRSLRDLWTKAEKERDANTLAFAALELRDPAQREQRLRLADEAVALDRSLTWIYVNLLDGRMDSAIPEPWVEQLVRWDSTNAVPYLFEAERIARQVRADWHKMHPQSEYSQIRQIDRNGRQNNPVIHDARWIAAMERAYDAPKFDSYRIRHSELNREVMRRKKIGKPIVAMRALVSHWLPSVSNAITFEEVLLKRGQEAERREDLEVAARWYRRAAQFGERVHTQTQSDFETLIARNIQEKAYRELQPLLAKMGKTSEAALVAYNLAEAEQSRAASTTKAIHSAQQQFSALHWPALLVQISALTVVLVSSLTIAAFLLFLGIGGKLFPALRGILCVALDFGPLLLFIACAAFLLSYHPFAREFYSYIYTPAQITELKQFQESFRGLMSIPTLLPSGPKLHVKFWWSVIISGSAVSAWLLKRMFRPRQVHSAA